MNRLDPKAARKLASDTAKWYFENEIEMPSEMSDFINKQSSKNPKMNDEIWAELMTRAIMSFHEGLEDRIDFDHRSASNDVELYEQAVDIVGDEAFNTIAFIVSAAGTRRPQELLGQASTLYMEAMNIANDNAAMEKGRSDTSTGYNRIWEIQQELEKMGSGMMSMSEQIGGYAADLQNQLNALVTYSPQTTSESGTGLTGLPTGVNIQ